MNVNVIFDLENGSSIFIEKERIEKQANKNFNDIQDLFDYLRSNDFLIY